MKTVLGYCAPWHAAPGESVDVKVSVADGGAFESQLLRVFCADNAPGGAGMDLRPVRHPSNGTHPGRRQTHPVGSCVIAPASPWFGKLPALTVQCIVKPTLALPRAQAIVSCWHAESRAGFLLEIDAQGRLHWLVGDGTGISQITMPERLSTGAWWSVWACFDGRSGAVQLGQRPVAPGLGPDRDCIANGVGNAQLVAAHALRLGIAARPDPDGGRFHEACFNGRIEQPLIVSRWLDASERDALSNGDLEPHALPGLVAAWDFGAAANTDEIPDRGPHGLHARAVNLPSRGVKGSRWRGDAQSWTQSPQQYAALHFHDDDLYDAGWDTDVTLALPADLPSGFYALRLRSGSDETCLPLFVRAPREHATSSVAFLASTATYIAYANYRFPLDVPFNEALLGRALTLGPAELHLQSHPELGLSTYDTHADGSGVRFSSRLRPMLNAGPGTDLWNYAADTHVLHWLEHIGQAVDVITDEDLHVEGAALLSRYRCVLTGTHPEYWTTPMWRGLEGWLANGGRLMYLGGNGFYWRCAMHPAWPGAVEVRRAEGGSRYWAEEPGEYHFAMTGEFAGLMRRVGTPPNALVGVGTRAIGFESPGWYERTPASADPRANFIFEGLTEHEPIGAHGVLGGAAGSEVDAADAALGTPRHALVLAASKGHGRDMYAVAEEVLMLNPGVSAEFNDALRAEMVFFETPSGGAVFSVGSIQWAASLPYQACDNNVSRITRNVLGRFVDPKPFVMPAIGSSHDHTG